MIVPLIKFYIIMSSDSMSPRKSSSKHGKTWFMKMLVLSSFFPIYY